MFVIQEEVVRDVSGRPVSMRAWLERGGEVYESGCKVVEQGVNDEATIEVGLRGCRDDVEFWSKTGAYA